MSREKKEMISESGLSAVVPNHASASEVNHKLCDMLTSAGIVLFVRDICMSRMKVKARMKAREDPRDPHARMESTFGRRADAKTRGEGFLGQRLPKFIFM